MSCFFLVVVFAMEKITTEQLDRNRGFRFGSRYADQLSRGVFNLVHKLRALTTLPGVE